MDKTGELNERVRGLIRVMPSSQREFARAIGLDETKLSKALLGKRKFSPHELVRIAGHCGVTVNWLLNGSEEASTVTAMPEPTTRSTRTAAEQPESELHRRILDTAWQRIAERGYHHVDLADVANAGGITQAEINDHFPTRADLLDEALRRNVKLAFDRQAAELQGIDDAHERLLRLVELQLPKEGLLRDEWSIWLQVWNESALNPAMRSLYWDSYNRWFRTIAMTIRDGQRQRVFQRRDSDQVAAQLTGLIDGLGIQVLTGKPGSSVNAMRAHLQDFIERTIAKEPRSL